MKKRIISVILLVSISMTLCVPAFAATPGDDNILPPWVEEGETWFPANGIMPLEDFGNCPKGHTGPSGYKYEGYTMGNVTAHYDDLALILVIGSMATKDPISYTNATTPTETNLAHAMFVTEVTGSVGSRTRSNIWIAAHNSNTTSAYMPLVDYSSKLDSQYVTSLISCGYYSSYQP